LSFDYKTTHFDKYYLIKLWTYLYFLNQKAVLYEDKRSVSNFWNKILKKENSKNKLSTKNVSNIDEWYFKSQKMTLQEVEFVKESLEQISLEELQGINSYIILRESDNVIKSELKLLTDLLKNSFILVITIIASYKILPKKILVEFF